MTASGTAGHGAELAAYLDLGRPRRGGREVAVGRALGRQPGAAAATPSPAGMLNSVGLQNPGVGTGWPTSCPPCARTGARVVASIWGFTVDDYGQAAAAIADA